MNAMMFLLLLFSACVLFVEVNATVYDVLAVSKILEDLNSLKVQFNNQKRENEELRSIVNELKSQFDSLNVEHQKCNNIKHDNEELKTMVTELNDNVELREIITEVKSQVDSLHVRNQELTNFMTLLQQNDKPRVDESGLIDKKADKEAIMETKEQNVMQPKAKQGAMMNLNQHRSRMYRHQRRETEANVAFFSTLANHQWHLGINQNVIFDNVVTNHGNGYNNHAGDFRAPIDGTYVFSVTLVGFVNDAHFSIVKGITSVGNLYLRGMETPLTTSSMTVVLDLAQGEDVSVKNLNRDQSVHGSHYSSFSGFLLTQKFGPVVVG